MYDLETIKEIVDENNIIILSGRKSIVNLIDNDFNLITDKHIRLIGDTLHIPGKVKCNTLIGNNSNFRCNELECKYFEVNNLKAKKVKTDSAFFHTGEIDDFSATKWIIAKELKCNMLRAPLAVVMKLICNENSTYCKKIISESKIETY